MIEIKIKLLCAAAKLPTKAYTTDSGWDCYTSETISIPPGRTRKVPLGIAVELPPGYELQGRPRSSSLANKGLHVAFGTVDNGYRGEMCAVVLNTNDHTILLPVGERILQLVPQAVVDSCLTEVDKLSASDRGENGWGSSG